MRGHQGMCLKVDAVMTRRTLFAPVKALCAPIHSGIHCCLRPFRLSTGLMLAVVLLTTTGCSLGWFSGPCYEPIDKDRCVVPRYETWPEVTTDPTFERDIEAPAITGGRLYLYRDRLFVSQGEDGVSVWSVSDPAQPEFEGVLTLAGNTDISIRGGVLYGNSYRDLVAIDLGDPDLSVSRVVDVFSYPRVDYDLPPEYAIQGRVDPEEGLLVGFTTLNNTRLDLNFDPIEGTDAQEGAD